MYKEVTALELQASSLRARAVELEAEQAKQDRLRRQALFNEFDTDGSGGVDAQELQRGWKELTGTFLDERAATRLLEAHDMDGNGVLEFEEFDVKRFQATLDRLWAEDEAAELAACQAEKEREEKLEAEKRLKEYYESLPGNNDTGLLTRVGSALPYILPLLDVSRFGVPLGILFPVLLPVVDLLYVPYALLDIKIPFGTLIIFFAMQAVAANKELPALLRFNFLQALQLDIAIFIPTLLRALSESVPGEDLSGWLWVVCSVVPFLIVTGFVTYSVLNSFCGIAPRGIPFISEAAERAMGVQRPDIQTNNEKDTPP